MFKVSKRADLLSNKQKFDLQQPTRVLHCFQFIYDNRSRSFLRKGQIL